MKIFRLATVICSGMIVFVNQSGAAESETNTPKNVAVESAAATSQPTTDVAAPDATAAFLGRAQQFRINIRIGLIMLLRKHFRVVEKRGRIYHCLSVILEKLLFMVMLVCRCRALILIGFTIERWPILKQ